jgi:hypothetical protein
MIKNRSIFALITFFVFFFSCSVKKDPATGEIENIEPNADKRARAYADKGGGIFGDINNQKKGSTNYEFSTSNVLWRATLKTLDFLPLVNADYSGGVIIYDWYTSDSRPSNEQIKISVRFLNNDLRSDSLQIISHKKICDRELKCVTSKTEDKFSNEIKEQILNSARLLRIEETKKEKK